MLKSQGEWTPSSACPRAASESPNWLAHKFAISLRIASSDQATSIGFPNNGGMNTGDYEAAGFRQTPLQFPPGDG